MRVYEIAYLDQHGNKSNWFSSRVKANKRLTELLRQLKNDGGKERIEHVNKITPHDIEMNKTGLLSFLNLHCKSGD